MSKIIIGISETINTGNYENIKLYVSIEKDVTTEIIDDAYSLTEETKILFKKAVDALNNQKSEIEVPVKKEVSGVNW